MFGDKRVSRYWLAFTLPLLMMFAFAPVVFNAIRTFPIVPTLHAATSPDGVAPRAEPVQMYLPRVGNVPTPAATAIIAGGSHSCALTEAGGVQCWGNNAFGQIGDGTTGDPQNLRLAPVNVKGLTTGVKAVELAYFHSCALTEAGSVKCWGSNEFGQLGDGGAAATPCGFEDRVRCSLVPGDVVGLTSGIQALAAGHRHTCALTNAGGVKCWGGNELGQLGDGKGGKWGDMSMVAVDVVGLSAGVKAIAASAGHTCALTTTGDVKCWGINFHANLGDGGGGVPCGLEELDICRLSPVDVVGLSSRIQDIAIGNGFSCALTRSGGVECWGVNALGALGDGTQGDTNQRRTMPTEVVGLSANVQAITAGSGHVCALTEAGGVKCWGYNSSGQLGDGWGRDIYCGAMSEQHCRVKPVDVVGLDTGVQAIDAEWMSTCAMMVTGTMKCWGSNFSGEVGDRTLELRPTPVDVIWP